MMHVSQLWVILIILQMYSIKIVGNFHQLYMCHTLIVIGMLEMLC